MAKTMLNYTLDEYKMPWYAVRGFNIEPDYKSHGLYRKDDELMATAWMQERQILSRQEAADYLGVSICYLDRLFCRKEHPLPRVKVGRRVMIPQKRLDQWLDEEIERGSSN